MSDGELNRAAAGIVAASRGKVSRNYEDFVAMSGFQMGPVTRVNFDTGMIEVQPYPIAEFVKQAKKPLRIIATDDLATTIGATWGADWRMMLDAIEKHEAGK